MLSAAKFLYENGESKLSDAIIHDDYAPISFDLLVMYGLAEKSEMIYSLNDKGIKYYESRKGSCKTT